MHDGGVHRFRDRLQRRGAAVTRRRARRVFKECIPVVVHGASSHPPPVSSGHLVKVERLRRLRGGNDDRLAEPTTWPLPSMRRGPDTTCCQARTSALGNAGLLLVLCASCIGVLSTGLAIVSGNRRGVRQGPLYAWLIAGGRVARRWSRWSARSSSARPLAEYIQQVGSNSSTPTLYNVAAMWSVVEGSILLWVVVLAGFTRSACGASESGSTTYSSAGRWS